MSIRVGLQHDTVYRYDRAIQLSPQIVRLRPAAHARTRILSYHLKIEPRQHFLNWQQDPAGNYLARIVVPERTREFGVHVSLIAEIAAWNPFDFFVEESAENFPFVYDQTLRRELQPYLESPPPPPELTEFLREIPPGPMRSIDFLVELNQRVARKVQYLIRMQPGIQSAAETLNKGSGSCRDSAWLMVNILRRLGLAARFVSGYLIQLKPDHPEKEGVPTLLQDFTDLHAWSEAFLPGAGWVGLDSTSGLLAAEGHIPLACSADPALAAPISGFAEPCESQFHFAMSVERLQEGTRSTRPYEDRIWQEIDAAGQIVDESLESADLRLTLGGEPTFVSAANADAPEWNLAADGGDKRSIASRLLFRLRSTTAPGAVVFHGQGKWYPGEALPRWAISAHFRRDQKAIWKDESLLQRGDEESNYTLSDAERLAQSLCRHLGVEAATLRPAIEDVYFRRWQDGDFYRRGFAAMSAALKRADQDPALYRGYVLPLRWYAEKTCWIGCHWPSPEEGLFLTPGDSPIGYRLPLSRLPPEHAPHSDFSHKPDPGDAPGELPEPETAVRKRRQIEAAATDASYSFSTALCVELRQGSLFVFFPPSQEAHAFLDLCTSVELALAECKLRAFLEGYEAPLDPRLQRLAVTPDPGVLEINVQPAGDWAELKQDVAELYAAATAEGLSAEKFLLDGRPTGAGGGAHITLGGLTPADSPFLRNPALLARMIAYWQRHPALSYVFSGLFVGPTSQAPRLDEARHESLYEMEIALQQLELASTKAPAPPWLVDRLFRNLLTDLTGNTHRAEFCIDKLYPPDRWTQRLGLVELRAFEMPPHEQMYLAQVLLVRALCAMLAGKGGLRNFVRWGLDLFDRFMLPHFLRQDLSQVIADLQEAGIPLRVEHFEPFFDFRFPVYGVTEVEDVRIELRMALEPWPVLGEISWQGNTSRPVDSAVERLQLKASNLIPDRFTILCNGRRLPLTPSGIRGEYVAGVRYKAWNPPNTMHPSIDVQTPLIFDLVDLWKSRSLGGCTYHVAHPGGRAYDRLPVNASEAESRRVARFARSGHTPGPIAVPPAEENPESPVTLDLRRLNSVQSAKP